MFKKKKSKYKILVTGGAGYIGSHIVRELVLKQKCDVTVLDDLSTGNKKAVHEKANFIKGSQLNESLLDKVFKEGEFDLVIHLSAKLLVFESIEKPKVYHENNIGGINKILSAMKKYDVKNIIFSSTGSVYGNAEFVPISENDPVKPINPYAETKLKCEQIIKNSGIKYLIFRYFNVAGAHPEGILGQSKKDHNNNIIPSLIKTSLEKNQIFNIFGDDYPTKDGTCVRDFIHIMDVVEAHVKGIKYIRKNNNSALFNLGSGKGYSIKKVIAEAERNGFIIPYQIVPSKKWEPARLIADIQKSKEELNFKASHDLKSILISERKWQEDKKF